MKPTVFCVLDTETSREFFPVFDLAWSFVDKKDNCLLERNFLATDVLDRITPKWQAKVAQYEWINVEKRLFAEIREQFNADLKTMSEQVGNLFLVSYHADFDRDALNLTTELMEKEHDFFTTPIPFIDLWGWWAESAPKSYRASINARGFPSTTLESVYRYEFEQPKFKKRGIARSDVATARKLVTRVLSRKKRLPITQPNESFAQPWKILKERWNTT